LPKHLLVMEGNKFKAATSYLEVENILSCHGNIIGLSQGESRVRCFSHTFPIMKTSLGPGLYKGQK